jgi:hypothetical protein
MMQISETPIRYAPRPDATPEMELNALSACYYFVLQKHQEKQECGPTTVPNDEANELERRQHCETKL